MRLVSWNVNGLRAVHRRGDLEWAFGGDIDVVCLQETKIQEAHVTPAMRAGGGGWLSWWCFGSRKGYSGTAIFVRPGLPAEPFPFPVGGAERPDFDDEGRVVAVDLGAFVLLNVYFPNGGSGPERLAFKHAWHERFLERVVELKAARPVVVCGDFNIAHRPVDVALPERWDKYSGFLPTERAWFDRLLARGFVDTFRAERGDVPRQFTFWETRLDARTNNMGWRIDYFVISADLEERLRDAWISPQILGSDHCPVGVELDVAGSAGHDAGSGHAWSGADGTGTSDGSDSDGSDSDGSAFDGSDFVGSDFDGSEDADVPGWRRR